MSGFAGAADGVVRLIDAVAIGFQPSTGAAAVGASLEWAAGMTTVRHDEARWCEGARDGSAAYVADALDTQVISERADR